jgi:hypothetical protein
LKAPGPAGGRIRGLRVDGLSVGRLSVRGLSVGWLRVGGLSVRGLSIGLRVDRTARESRGSAGRVVRCCDGCIGRPVGRWSGLIGSGLNG